MISVKSFKIVMANFRGFSILICFVGMEFRGFSFVYNDQTLGLIVRWDMSI